jgi:hypothetical protein
MEVCLEVNADHSWSQKTNIFIHKYLPPEQTKYAISVILFLYSTHYFKHLRFKEHKIEHQHKESRY